jgi:hypothetical protein
MSDYDAVIIGTGAGGVTLVRHAHPPARARNGSRPALPPADRDPPRPRPRGARFETDHVDAGRERVRRAGHRFDRDGVPPPGGRLERVPRVDLEVAERLVRPDLDDAFAVGRLEPGARPAVRLTSEAGETGVEPHGADGRPTVKSNSVPATSASPTGRALSSVVSRREAGIVRRISSTGIPTVR